MLSKLKSALRKQSTSILAGLVALALGSVLIAIELALAGWYLAAIGILLVAGAGALALHKLGAVVSRVVEVRKQLRNLARGTMTHSSSKASVPSEGQYSKQELRLIGSYVPQKPASTAIGRQAAAVMEDPKAQQRLFAATHGLGAAMPIGQGRCIAVISPTLEAGSLGAGVNVARLHPSLSKAELQQFAPDTIIIDELANDRGPWAGFLHPSGAALFREAMAIVLWAENNGVQVHVVAHPDGIPYVAPVLREAANNVVSPGDTAGPGILSALGGAPRQLEQAGA